MKISNRRCKACGELLYDNEEIYCEICLDLDAKGMLCLKCGNN